MGNKRAIEALRIEIEALSRHLAEFNNTAAEELGKDRQGSADQLEEKSQVLETLSKELERHPRLGFVVALGFGFMLGKLFGRQLR